MRRCFLLLVCLALSACQYGVRNLESAADVLPGDLILVGKVTLDPPLAEDEQQLGMTEKAQQDLINLLLSTEQVMIDPSSIRYRDFQTAVKASLGTTFFALAPYRQANISGGMIYLNVSDRFYFPGGWRYQASDSDQAIYIGTIQYRRNTFNEVVGARVIDEYSQASREFAGKFGTDIKLRKSLLSKASR